MRGHAKVADTSETSETPDAQDDASATLEETPSVPELKKPQAASQAMQAIRLAEDMALKDYLELLGPQGAIRVRVNRTAPKTVRVNGKDYNTEGHQVTFDHTVDEEYLREELGGGTYDLVITSRTKSAGSFKYAGHRTVKVAGDPKVEKLPTNATTPVSQTSGGGESPGFVKEVVGLLKGELEHAREPKPDGINPAVQLLIDQLRDDARRRDREVEDMRRQLGEAQNRRPPEDPIKDEILKSMLSGQSGHVTALQLRYEAEIRQSKESAAQDLKRLEERHDRTMSEMRQSHELALSHVKSSYEREIAALRSSHDVSLQASSATHAVQIHTLSAEIKRLERDNDDHRKDNRELRDKKEKGVIEQIKDLNALKEAIGVGDEKDDSMAEKVIAAMPAAIESIGGLIDRKRATQQVAQIAQAQVAAKPRVVATSDGRRYLQKGDQLIAVKPKPKTITTEAGGEIEIPQVEPAQLALLISLLEQSFRRDEAPEIVAQTGKAQIPADILAWIRQHHSEQVSGVDLFMQKVAKLPGTSPLATQAGRNWLRKVGAALIGE